MKKLIFIFTLLFCVFVSEAQTYKGYVLEAYERLQAKKAFIIDNDTLRHTTQVSYEDDTIVTRMFLKFDNLLDVPRTKSGQAGKIVMVNETEDSLIYSDVIPKGTKIVEQVSHGLIEGNWIRLDKYTGLYTKARADTTFNADVIGIVDNVYSVDSFSYQYSGVYKKGDWTPGTNYYLDPDTEGEQTEIDAFTAGEVRVYLGTGLSTTELLLEIDVGVLIVEENQTDAQDLIVTKFDTDSIFIEITGGNEVWLNINDADSVVGNESNISANFDSSTNIFSIVDSVGTVSDTIVMDTSDIAGLLEFVTNNAVTSPTDTTGLYHSNRTILDGIDQTDIDNWDEDLVDDADADPTNELQDTTNITGLLEFVINNAPIIDTTGLYHSNRTVIDGITETDINNWDNDLVDDADNDPTNELQDTTNFPGLQEFIENYSINEESLYIGDSANYIQWNDTTNNTIVTDSYLQSTINGIGLGLMPAQILSCNDTITHDYLDGNNVIIELCGNINLYNFENVPDGGFGSIVLIQDETGGFVVDSFHHDNLYIYFEIHDTVQIINNGSSDSYANDSAAIADTLYAHNLRLLDLENTPLGTVDTTGLYHINRVVLDSISQEDIDAWNTDLVDDADNDPTNELQDTTNINGLLEFVINNAPITDTTGLYHINRELLDVITTNDTLRWGIDTDTQLSEAQVDAFVSNNGYLDSTMYENEKTVIIDTLDSHNDRINEIVNNLPDLDTTGLYHINRNILDSINQTDIDNWDNDLVDDADNDPTNELQDTTEIGGLREFVESYSINEESLYIGDSANIVRDSDLDNITLQTVTDNGNITNNSISIVDTINVVNTGTVLQNSKLVIDIIGNSNNKNLISSGVTAYNSFDGDSAYIINSGNYRTFLRGNSISENANTLISRLYIQDSSKVTNNAYNIENINYITTNKRTNWFLGYWGNTYFQGSGNNGNVRGIFNDITFNSPTDVQTKTDVVALYNGHLFNKGGDSISIAEGYYAKIANEGASYIKSATVGSFDFGSYGTSVTDTITGLQIGLWNKPSGTSTVYNSYGIRIDTTIDMGINRWAIHSLSKSKSLFSGNVIIPNAIEDNEAVSLGQVNSIFGNYQAKSDTLDWDATKYDLKSKQASLNGTGFVKASGTSISYDNSTYLNRGSTNIDYNTQIIPAWGRNSNLSVSNAPTTGVHWYISGGNNDSFSTLGGQLALGYSSGAGSYQQAKLYMRSKASPTTWNPWIEAYTTNNSNLSTVDWTTKNLSVNGTATGTQDATLSNQFVRFGQVNTLLLTKKDLADSTDTDGYVRRDRLASTVSELSAAIAGSGLQYSEYTELSYVDTIHHDFTDGTNYFITITGDISLFEFSNIPDGGFGSIVIEQNGIGGFEILNFMDASDSIEVIIENPEVTFVNNKEALNDTTVFNAVHTKLGTVNFDSNTTQVISIENLKSGMQGTIYMTIGSLLPTAIQIKSYTDNGITELNSIVLGNALTASINKVTAINYSCVNDIVYLTYNQQQ